MSKADEIVKKLNKEFSIGGNKWEYECGMFSCKNPNGGRLFIYCDKLGFIHWKEDIIISNNLLYEITKHFKEMTGNE